VRSDSNTSPRTSDLQFGVAERAVRSGRIERGTEAGDAGRVAEAALPLRIRPPRARRARVFYVVVYSQPLGDVAGGVRLIRGRILVAGAIALALAILAGLLVASSVSRRVKRMEHSARRVAQGDFTARFDVGARDELGRLARTLDGMQRQLAELETARSRFIATASHELRTPIFSIGGFLELLEDEELDEETRVMFIRQVREQVDRLGRLATDLLDLSKLEAGSLELRPERTGPARDRRGRRRRVRPALAAHESHLELRLAGGRGADVRPGAGGADHAYPHRQRPEPHPGGHRRGRALAAGRAGTPLRDRLRHRHQARRDVPASSSPSTPPTTPRAPASASRSPTSSPSAWRASSRRERPRRTTFSLELPA
jgi:signal transduction histidine kinase